MISDKYLEADILASCLFGVSEDAPHIAVNSLSSSDFWLESHQEIFKAMQKSISEQGQVDMDIIYHYTPESYEPVVADIMNHRTLPNIDPLLMRLKRISKLREVHKINSALPLDLKEIDSLEETLNDYESKVFQTLQENSTTDKGETVKDGLSGFMNMLEEEVQYNRGKGIPFGFPSLDKATGGMRSGEVITIAGRSGMGKSSFFMSILANLIVTKQKPKPAVFSLEMSKDEIYKKLFSMISELRGDIIPFYKLRNLYGDKETLNRIARMVQYLQDSDVYINCDPRINFDRIRSISRDRHRKGLLDSIYIDHIKLMVQDYNREREQLSYITNESKRLSKELEVPVILISQLGRDAEKNGFPRLSDLKGSGTIEEDSDIVIFPWRPFAVGMSDNKHEGKILMAKGRNANPTPAEMYFSTDTTLIREGTSFDIN